MTGMIKIKRVYDPPAADDGARFLVDRYWPRGTKRAALADAPWLRDVAPSGDLCQWFGHDAQKWDEFQQRYAAELDGNPAALQTIITVAQKGTVTLLYSARETEHNNAIVLKAYLEGRMKAAQGE
jgi:uncharacterized protein YeaO (DUF488 family)